MTPAGDAAYVAAVLMLYTDLPDTPLRPSSQDQAMARRLHQQGVPLPLVESALLLASLRRLIRPGLPPLPRIRSLAYFQSVIAELQEHPPTRGLPRLPSAQIPASRQPLWASVIMGASPLFAGLRPAGSSLVARDWKRATAPSETFAIGTVLLAVQRPSH